MKGTGDIHQQSPSTATLTAEQTETSGDLTTKGKEVSVSHTGQVSGDTNTTISETMSPKTSSAATDSLAASPSLSNPTHHPPSPKTSSAATESQAASQSPSSLVQHLPPSLLTSGDLTTKGKEVSVSHTGQVSGDTNTTISETMSPKTSSAATDSLAASPSLSNPTHHPPSPKTSSAATESQAASQSPSSLVQHLPPSATVSQLAPLSSSSAGTVSQSSSPLSPSSQHLPPSATVSQQTSSATTVSQSAPLSPSSLVQHLPPSATVSQSAPLSSSSAGTVSQSSSPLSPSSQHLPPSATVSQQTSSATTHFQPPPILQNLTQAQQPSPYQAQIAKWRKFVERCHEVIGILIGFLMVFAPVNFLIQTVRSNDHGPADPAVPIVKLIISFLVDFKMHLVYPFIIVALIYVIIYTASAADLKVVYALWLDMFGIVFGFGTAFVVLYHIWPIASIVGGCVCGIIVIGLFIWQFPRERAAINNIGIP